MELQIEGKLEKFLSIETGAKKDGSGDWKKQLFLVKTTAEYNNLYCFEVFGDEKVENLTKYQKEGDNVKVVFNVNTNEWKGKYYTSLSAWRIEKANTQDNPSNTPQVGSETNQMDVVVEDNLPF